MVNVPLPLHPVSPVKFHVPVMLPFLSVPVRVNTFWVVGNRVVTVMVKAPLAAKVAFCPVGPLKHELRLPKVPKLKLEMLIVLPLWLRLVINPNAWD